MGVGRVDLSEAIFLNRKKGGELPTGKCSLNTSSVRSEIL